MEKLFFFLGGAVIVLGAIILGVVVVRRKIRGLFRRLFGTTDIAMIRQGAIDAIEEEEPKSVSGGDSIFLPAILRDFPDYNNSLAKTYVRKELERRLKDKASLSIHKVVIHDYQPSTLEKTIVYQAALQYRENGKLLQKRYNLHYSFLLPSESGETIAANCPNCGGAITSTHQKICAYCGSRLANVMKNTWEFTEVYEK